jgi:hypothetical protein
MIVAGFHPEFYAAMATVLPVLLLVTNLSGFFVEQPRMSGDSDDATLYRVAGTAAGWLLVIKLRRIMVRTSAIRLFSAMIAVVLNVVAETVTLAALFGRSVNTIMNVLIWVGFACSMLWVAVALSMWLVATSFPKESSSAQNQSQPTTSEPGSGPPAR